MRPAVRMALAAATTLAVTLPLGGAAIAATPSRPDPSVPSRAQVERADRDVATKRRSVQQIEAALAAAQARMEQAAVAAEAAAEAYNGAMWRLDEARKETAAARAAQHRAARSVARQRNGIVQLVTESYQNGTELNTATALMSGEGPQGLMNRYAVVQSAGDSMQADYDTYRAAAARARAYAATAARAEAKQQKLAEDARQLAAAAGQAATSAGIAASEIAVQKQALVRALARAQNISVELAGQRQAALEEIARRRAAEARRAHEEAVQAALQKQAEAEARAAAKKAEQSKRHQPEPSHSPSTNEEAVIALPAPVAAPAPIVHPAPNQSTAVQRAIAYAKSQLGKPYQWAATGPATFDCSGLTMQAWARGGKSLPHYSVAQYSQSTPIRMSDAKAGDLLFWSNNGSPSGIHHVALYLGGGQFIEAPHTGAFVRYNSISNWYPDFAARP